MSDAPQPPPWKFAFPVGVGIGLGIATSKAVEAALLGPLGYWGALAVGLLAAAGVGGLAALAVAKALR